jgi:hypothetical protein
MAKAQRPLPVRITIENQRLLLACQLVTYAVQSPVGPATRWMRVVSMALERVMVGRMVVSRRASMDVPAPGGPKRRPLWAERLHPVQFYVDTWGSRDHSPAEVAFTLTTRLLALGFPLSQAHRITSSAWQRREEWCGVMRRTAPWLPSHDPPCHPALDRSCQPSGGTGQRRTGTTRLRPLRRPTRASGRLRKSRRWGVLPLPLTPDTNPAHLPRGHPSAADGLTGRPQVGPPGRVAWRGSPPRSPA